MKWWLVSFIIVASACASRLNPVLRKNSPSGHLETEIDLALLQFTSIESGEPVNVAEYMEQEGLTNVLLIFGSMDCISCNEKSQVLQDQVIGKHELFLSDRGKKFQIIGVNTDKEYMRLRLQSYVTEKFPYIRWSDPSGHTMIEQLLGPNEGFGVPFNVLLSRKGIVWRIDNKTKLTVKELVARVQRDLGLSGDGDIDDTEEPTPTPTPTPDVIPSDCGDMTFSREGAEALKLIGPERFRKLNTCSCAGNPVGLATSLTADGTNVFVVDGGTCAGSTCLQNIAKARQATAACTGVCKLTVLTTEKPGAELCAEMPIAQGGAEFFAVYSSHFNWRYEVKPAAGGRLTLAPLGGPLTLAFDHTGRLIFSNEGVLDEARLSRALNGNGDFAPGANQTLFADRGDSGLGNLSLAEITAGAYFTVVSSFSYLCAGCVDKLAHWSEPGELFDICIQATGRCQIFAAESEDADDWGKTDAAFYNFLMHGENGQPWPGGGMISRGVRVPLLLDPVRIADQGVLKRFYSYLQANDSAWETYGTVIYDREGKIIASIPSSTTSDPVKQKVEELLR